MVADYPLGSQGIDGGVQGVTAYLVDALRSRSDVDIEVVTFDKFRQFGKSDRTINDVPVHLLPRHRLGNVTLYQRDATEFRRLIKKLGPDVIHAQGTGVESYVAIRSGAAMVGTVHGLLWEYGAMRGELVEKTRLMLQSLVTERTFVRSNCDKIMISPYVKQYFGDRLRGKCHDIPNPVDERFFNIHRRDEPGRILFVGRIAKRKGVIDLINALAHHQSASGLQLRLAGAIENQEYRKQLGDVIAASSIADRVHFLGLLNSSQLQEELARCTCMVLPSYQETAPLVIQEAMAAGVPVVATNIAGIPYQVISGRTGFIVEPGDVPALSKTITTLSTNASLRQSLGDYAKRTALECYTASQVAAKTVDVYREIADRKPHTRAGKSVDQAFE
jgi:glycosyltransferase involved in cell wall biosynthesis